MNFTKGWGRIERLLLIVGIIGSICAIVVVIADGFAEAGSIMAGVMFGASWVPYLVAKLIAWIVRGFADKDERLESQTLGSLSNGVSERDY